VNTKNVGKLVPAWSFSFGGEKQRGQESQPLIYNGKMFVTASYSRIFAIDLKTGNKLWKYEHRLPDGIMPCCDVVNRGAALYGNLVIFGTLDAQLVALDQDTGKVVWKEKVDDYAAGYSMTAAPLIADGLLLTGVSGGEFGIVGRVEARNPLTGELVWSRPTVEGHMGHRYDKDGKAIDNGISGTPTRPGRATCGRPAAPRPGWAAPMIPRRAGLLRHRQSGAMEQPSASRRQPVFLLHRGAGCEDGPDQVGIPEHAERLVGLRRRQRIRHLRHGWQALWRQGRPQRLLLRDRCEQRQAAERFPVRAKITWASGIDLKTGRPNFIPPTVLAIRPRVKKARRAARCLPRRPSSARRTRCRWPTASRPAVLRARQRMGHGYLE
jgi:alcohol dehydrogenase (cytochrome c)